MSARRLRPAAAYRAALVAGLLGAALAAGLVGAALAAPRAPTDDDLRQGVLAALRSQHRSVASARATVDDKLTAASASRAKRARAASRALRERAAVVPLEQARRRAAVAWLLAREQSEVALLAEERALLDAASERLATALVRAQAAPLPPRELRWPAAGDVVRSFGRLAHERSGATLARRGVDLEVAPHAAATAMAAGTVVYAGPIRGLDEGVLTEHDGYFTLVAKLAELRVRAGDRVEPSTAVGRAAKQRLYVELRLALLPSGLSIDPAPFVRRREPSER